MPQSEYLTCLMCNGHGQCGEHNRIAVSQPHEKGTCIVCGGSGVLTPARQIDWLVYETRSYYASVLGDIQAAGRKVHDGRD